MQQASRLTWTCLCLSDAFADAAEQEEDTSGVDYVHIRIQQRNGKKSLTTVQVDLMICFCYCCSRSLFRAADFALCVPQGLKKSYDYKKVLKALKKGKLTPRASSAAWSSPHTQH